MASQLKNILSFVDIPAGGSSVLAHGLNWNGLPVVPDVIEPGVAGGTVTFTANTVNVTATNDGPEDVSISVLVESWHTIERAFGDEANKSLTPQPFIVGGADGAYGPTYGLGPTNPGLLQPAFVTPQQTITYYVRTTGSDETGDGSLANPWETVQYAFRNIPVVVPPGIRYLVDDTGITEIFPIDYELPAFKSPEENGYNPTNPYFLYDAAVTLQATPRLVAAIPPADASILFTDVVSQVAQTGSGLLLVTFTTVRASWAANALSGKFLVQPTHATPASVVCTILESTSTTLLITSTAVLTKDMILVEPSASLSVDCNPSQNGDRGGLNSYNIDSIAFNGQKITQRTTPAASFGLCAVGHGQVCVQMCELQNAQLASGSLNLTKCFNNWIYGERFRANDFLATTGVYFDGIDQFALLNMRGLHMTRCGVYGKGTAGTLECLAQAPGSTRFPEQTTMKIEATYVNGILGATADGIRFNGGRGQFDNLLINGCGRDGIRCEDDTGFLRANNIRSTVANGVTAATGVGIRVNDGMIVRVDSATSAAAGGTTLTGAGGDMKVGNLAVRTWADFVANAPVKNQYDLLSPFVTNVASGKDLPAGDDVVGAGTGGCTGSRLFQRT